MPETTTDRSTSIRVFLLDDHEIVRAGLARAARSRGDMEVVGEAGTVDEAIAADPAAAPDVAVLDVRLPDGSGVEVCRDVRSRDPDDPLPDAHVVRRRRGAVRRDHGRRLGLRAQGHPGNDLVDAIRASRRVSRCSTRRRPRACSSGCAADPEDEAREPHRPGAQILELIGEGLTNRQIGERMFLAEKTVKNYVSNLLAKLGMERRTQAAVLASHCCRTNPTSDLRAPAAPTR